MNKHVKHYKIKPEFCINKEVRNIIKQLKNSEIDCFCVPEEYQDEKRIVDIERKLGMRKVGKRGYDIIKNMFFVEEQLNNDVHTKRKTTYFQEFNSYFSFVDGKIYDDACYYQCDVSKIKKRVDYDRFYQRKFLVEHTIDYYTASPTAEEIILYDKREQIKNQCKQWITLFSKCSTVEEFRKVNLKYRQSKLSRDLVGDTFSSYIQYRDFFMWQYISLALKDKKRFHILMEYMSCYTCADSLVREVCAVFDPDDVMEAYNFRRSSKQSVYKQKKRLQDIVDAVKYGFVDMRVLAFFDEVSHYYCEKCTYILQDEQLCQSEGMRNFSTYRYFESFDDFIKYRNGDLTNCDLTKAIKLDYDFTKCKMDATTKLPLGNVDKLRYAIKKKYSDDTFKVVQEWYNSYGTLVKRYIHNFEYFFDFVAFMKGDLSDADLLFCDGLRNLKNISEINFMNAKITSMICDKLGIAYKKYKVDNNRLGSFALTEQNEKSTGLVLQTSRELATAEKVLGDNIVYYVSDIHLLHKLKNNQPKSTADVLYMIKPIVDAIIKPIVEGKPIVDNIIKKHDNIILIGGDVSSDFSIFTLFVEILRRELDRNRCNPLVIFVLGNHELWEFPNNTLEEIVIKYNDLLNKHGMYLLHNDVLYKDSKNIVHRINAEKLLSSEDKSLRREIRTSRIIFFGGLGFSGYNEEFNANNGIYRDTINRETEIKETEKFEELYKKACSTFSDKNLIVFTHMPIDCWNKEADYQENYIYVSGHTHRNYFYDDGCIRIYADNQIGYRRSNLRMKWFYIEDEYDYFVDYQDGIHKISSYEYLEFYRGKNLMINFNRAENVIYMLKKNGYYCFIHESRSGSLSILNGGAMKKLYKDDVNYYYENMDLVIALIKKPLESYTTFQEDISMEIRRIGGMGKIHGCIIDIDLFNHVFVNPVDGKITGYWARDIMYRIVYPSVPELLQERCPALYVRYVKLLDKNSEYVSYLKNSGGEDLNLLYGTAIYKASREIKKIQKLSSNILTTWYDLNNSNKGILFKQN